MILACQGERCIIDELGVSEKPVYRDGSYSVKREEGQQRFQAITCEKACARCVQFHLIHHNHAIRATVACSALSACRQALYESWSSS